MKITAMAAMMVITAAAGMSANARQAGESAGQRVIVYVNNDLVQPGVLQRAKAVAGGMFSRTGVQIDWRGRVPEGGHLPAETIAIGFALKTPVQFMPGALAFARPYEGVHITVFCDRVQRLAPRSDLEFSLLAHVLVHEITHILQGIDRHSESGVMKARWDGADYAAMTSGPLPFTPEDIALIHRGLAE